jgi:hypothetical protein
MKGKPMGKGLNAILKAPERLKPVSRTSDVTAEKITASELDEEEAAAKEVIAPEAIKETAATAEVPSEEAVKKPTTSKLTAKGDAMSQDIISRAVSDAKRSPRISTWSPVAVSTLKFLRMTQPQFSMSDEMRTLIEEALAKKYPTLVEKVKKELEKSS